MKSQSAEKVINKPPDPIELRGSCAADKEVDTEQVPVLGDDDQRVSGPDQACRSTTLGETVRQRSCFSNGELVDARENGVYFLVKQ